MAKLVLRGSEILEIAHNQFPSDIDSLCGNCKMLIVDLINSSQMEAYEAGQQSALDIAQQLAARKKVEDDKSRI